jgi:HSP20 family protein
MANAVIRWNPFRELAAMQSAMDRIFDETWRENNNWNGNTLPIDVHENDDSYTVVANVPGVNPDDINITFHDGVLSISLEVAQDDVKEGTRVHVQERFYGNLTRRFSLGQNVTMDDVEANYDNGVLTLVLPKAEEAKPRQIRVNNRKMLNGNNN